MELTAEPASERLGLVRQRCRQHVVAVVEGLLGLLDEAASRPFLTRAVEHGMDTLALTDRDGAYGAVRFVKACQRAGVRPVLGVDLALAASGLVPQPDERGGPSVRRPRTPVRGGTLVYTAPP